MSKPLILVDGSSYLYRAFHALPQLMNSKGLATGAVYGVVNMLKRLMSDYQPEYMAVVFDAKGKTFRDDLYPAYKATRQAMPEDLAKQIEPLHEIIETMGIPLITIQGVEADDVIGTLAQKAKSNKLHTLISTGDKDLAQLVNEDITLINTMTNVKLDPKGVVDKFGVSPHQIIDYLTLIGDTSDNIPGVSKVGPKTAAKWLQEHGSLKELIKHADQLSGKVGENFRAFLPQVALTQSLVTINLNVPLAIDFAQLKLQPANKPKLIEMFKQLEFKSWLNELLSESENLNHEKHKHYTTITDNKTLDDWILKLQKAALFAFVTETTDPDPQKAQLVGLSFAIGSHLAAYIPFGHDYDGAPVQLAKKLVLEKLKPLFENGNIQKVAHNLKYHLEVLKEAGIEIKNASFDTMLQSYILDSASNAHQLDSLALKYLGWRPVSYEEIAGKGAKELRFNQIDVKKAGIFSAESADVILQLHQLLSARLKEEAGLKRVFEEIEIPLTTVLAKMEGKGVLIDPDQLVKQGITLEKRLKALEKEAFDLAGVEFNINSPKQLQEILFQKLNLPILQKTPTGQPSTADPVLQELALEFALPQIIIECRSLSKLISTYTSKLITQINPRTHRVHTTYNQAGTATGRLSSSDPNLQNIPIRGKEGRKIRQAFIAPKQFKLISADYSQIELRLMAHISGDPNLISAFQANLDIHQATASEVWGVAIEKVTPDMRRNAKAINFGLIYGMSAFGLTRQLGISRQEAQSYIDRYFSRYPGVMAYMTNIREKAKEKGYVETLWGRRLYLPDINASQIPRRKAAERIAINAPLQGSAADIIKLAMININQWLTEKKMGASMLMQVHDELVFEVPLHEVNQLLEGVREQMVNVVSLKVPLLVSIGIGDNWDDASAH